MKKSLRKDESRQKSVIQILNNNDVGPRLKKAVDHQITRRRKRRGIWRKLSVADSACVFECVCVCLAQHFVTRHNLQPGPPTKPPDPSENLCTHLLANLAFSVLTHRPRRLATCNPTCHVPNPPKRQNNSTFSRFHLTFCPVLVGYL